MMINVPVLETHYSPRLDLLCAKVSVMYKQDSTKQFRIRRTSYGLWRMEVR